MAGTRLFLTLLAVLALLPAGVQAQNSGTIAGRVVDATTQQPLPGAQVFIAGSTRGTLTNAQGQFLIPGVAAGQQTVRASLIGYSQGEQAVVVAPGQTATVNLALSPSAVELDAIVINAVTGQAERKRELGTNVANIQVDDIEKAPITRAADVLTARVPGVSVQGSGGTTGTTQRIRIRGANSLSLSNEPLIFVDGVQFSNQVFDLGSGGAASSRLNDINPNDIESIEILKGPAATSQYGTAAANGVILISTKRGIANATRWTTYAEYGVITEPNEYPANFFSYQLNTPGAPLFRENGSANAGNAASSARRACYNFQAAAGTCRQDSTAVFNTLEDPRTTPFQDGFRRKYGASVSGGSDRATYFISGDLEDEQGVIQVNQLDRVNVRANLNANVTDRLRVQVSSGYVDSDLSINSNDASVFSPLINGYVGRAFFNPDTTTAIFNRNYRQFSPSALREYTPQEGINRLTLGGLANYQPFGWLSVAANAGLDFTNRLYQITLQPGRSLGTIAPGFYGIGFRNAFRTNQFLWTANTSAAANFELTDRLVSTTTVGGSYQRDLYRTLDATGAGIVEGTRDVGSATGQFSIDEDFSEVRTIGAFVSQQFAYDDRLFLTVGIRGDDNSAFGTDFGFVTYPNANFSWVLNEETWFPETDLLSSLRVRAGYGTSGLRPNFRQAITLYEPAGVQVGGADVPGVILDVTGNTALEPERTTEYEAGLDAGLFGDRLAANLTYFNRTSEDALISVPLPPSFGLTTTRIANLGSVRNSGFELGLDARVVDTRPVKLQMRLSTTTLDNEVVSIGGVDDIVINRGAQRHREGFPAGAYFQDRYVIEDNGDGLLSLSEVRVVRDTVNGEVVPNFIGPVLPTYSNALSGDLTLFNFITVSTLFEQRGGNYQLDYSTFFRCRTSPAFGDRGCAANADPNASLEEQAAYIAGTYKNTVAGYIHPADFIKWRELSVTLGVPEQFDRFEFLRGASLTVAGRNLGTWTDYPGMDPEIAEQGTGNFNQNEFNTQPPVRYWTARLNFTF